jgi:hypothetical protein
MNATLSIVPKLLMLGALICLLGSAASFAHGIHTVHEWAAALTPLGLAIAMLDFASRQLRDGAGDKDHVSLETDELAFPEE